MYLQLVFKLLYINLILVFGLFYFILKCIQNGLVIFANLKLILNEVLCFE